MDTSDEGIVSSLTGFASDLPGARNLAKVDPVLRKQFKKRDDELEEEEELRRQEAAAVEQEQRTVTAEALPQQTELERRNRRRRASVLTRDFAPATLGRTGLLG